MASGIFPHLATASSFSSFFQPLLTISYLQLPSSPKTNYYIKEEEKKNSQVPHSQMVQLVLTVHPSMIYPASFMRECSLFKAEDAILKLQNLIGLVTEELFSCWHPPRGFILPLLKSWQSSWWFWGTKSFRYFFQFKYRLENFYFYISPLYTWDGVILTKWCGVSKSFVSGHWPDEEMPD